MFGRAAAFRSISALLVSLTITASTSTISATPRASVIGALEGIDSSGIAFGWAQDTDTPSASISVHVYLNGPAGGGGTFAGAVTASIPRGNPGLGRHGFRFPIPSQYRDAAAHSLYVYGIDSAGISSENAVLSGVPQHFTLASTVVRLQNGTIQFGVEPRCGGTLVEVSLNGQNLVNNFDCTGRQVQAAFYDGDDQYDGCGGCQGVWGWDPVQGGDRFNFGSPLTAQSVQANSISVSTQPYEWYPDNKGGGPGRPVLSDVSIEQTVSFVPQHPSAIHIHYRIHHFGSDSHSNAVQELPAVYVNRGYDNFVTYSGTTPWTGGAVTSTVLTQSGQPAPQRYISEQWAALVNSQGIGLTVYVPQQYSYAAGARVPGTAGEYGSGANYFRPHVPFTFGPGAILDADIYVIAGTYQNARQVIQSLHAAGQAPDILPPFGSVDQPGAGQSLSGTVTVSGWALDNSQVAGVDVLIDGIAAGSALYGSSRPDVSGVYPQAPPNSGYSYALDTTRYANGSHQLLVRALDVYGNTAILSQRTIVVNNSGGQPPDTTAPSVMISSVSTNSSRAELTVRMQATDAVGVTRLELYVDGQLVGTDTTPPYRIEFLTASLSPGTHQITARAYDAAGNVGISAPVQWTK